jgi:hypothetical protein
MISILMIIYVSSVITMITLLALDLKSHDSLCLGDVVVMAVVIFTPILNTILLLGLLVESLDIQWTEILEKQIWKRK